MQLPGVETLTTTAVPVQRVMLARGVVIDPEALVRPLHPLGFKTRDEAEIVLDFGRETVGGVELRLTSERGGEIECFYGEDLPEAFRETDYTFGWYSLPHDTLDVAAGEQTCRTPGRRAFRYVRLRLRGALTVQGVTAWHEHHPVTLMGSFSCSDPLLNRAWALCEHNTRCCMQRYYEDGVKRDGLLWLGDYRVSYLCNAYLYGDVELAARSLRFFAATQQDDGRLLANAVSAGAHQHPDRIPYMKVHSDFQYTWSLINYTADFVCALRDLLLHAPAEALIAELWPVTTRVLAYLRKIDETTCERRGRHAFLSEVGDGSGWQTSRAALAMQLLAAVRAGDWLARQQVDTAEAARCRTWCEEQAPRFRERYRLADLGCISDADPDATLMIHATSQAVLAGLHHEADEAAAWLQAADQCPRAQRPKIGFAIGYWVEALFRAGLATTALREARAYWGHLLRHDATTCWGTIDLEEDGIRRPDTHAISHCHGWSAGLSYLLPGWVLGVRPNASAARVLTVAPQLGDLAWAEGTIPLPDGTVRVSWERDGDSVHGTLDIDTAAEVTVETRNGPSTCTRGHHAVRDLPLAGNAAG